MNSLQHLFAEDPWPVVCTLAVVAVGLAVAAVGTGRGHLLVWIAVLGVLAASVLITEQVWVTDAERIDGVVDSLARAVQREDVEGIVRHLAPQFRYGGYDRHSVAAFAAGVFHEFDVHRVSISQRQTRVARLSRRGTAQFMAVTRAEQSGQTLQPHISRWVLTFTQDAAGQWQVLDAQQVQAFGDERGPVWPR
jgi:hypothetical protein